MSYNRNSKRKTITLSDVAKDAGVSITTVSHVVNNSAKISADTCKRVTESIERLGYSPLPGSEFRNGNRMIAVFIPDLGNEFYAKSVQAIFNCAWQHKYGIVVCDMQHLIQAESGYLRNLLLQGVCGVIFFGETSNIEAQILRTADKVPVVLGDMHIPRGLHGKVDAVCTDNEKVVTDAVTRFARAGYSEFGYVSEDFLLANTRDRYKGFVTGLQKNGLKLYDEWLFISENLRLNKIKSSYEYFSNILKTKPVLPQILFCTSDLIAIGICSALKDSGIDVPKEVGVVGFDDISLAAYVNPPLTTIAQNMEKIGESCMELLLDRIENQRHEASEITVQAKLEIRKTVKM